MDGASKTGNQTRPRAVQREGPDTVFRTISHKGPLEDVSDKSIYQLSDGYHHQPRFTDENTEAQAD